MPSRLSTRHGRRCWRPAGAIWPFRVEANCFHLELRPGEWTFLLPPSVPGVRSGTGAVYSRSPCLFTWHGHPLRGFAGAISFFCPSTWHGRRRRGAAGAVWPFRVEAKCLHLELRHREWTFLWPPSVPGGVPWFRSLPVFPSPGGVAEVDSQCKKPELERQSQCPLIRLDGNWVCGLRLLPSFATFAPS